MRIRRHILEHIRQAIRAMRYHSPIYRMLKEELSKLGYWRNRKRGRGSKSYFERKKEIKTQ